MAKKKVPVSGVKIASTDGIAQKLRENLLNATAHLHPTQNEIDSGYTHNYRQAVNEVLGGGLASAVAKSEPQFAKKPLLSIVTIFDTANEKKWLEQFIDRLPSLPDAHLGLIEIVMCKNEQGAGETLEIDEQILQSKNLIFRRCKYTYTEWRFDSARNAAKQAATGEWILSLDTDEYIDKWQLPKILDSVESAGNRTGGIYCTAISHVRQEEGFGLEAVQRVCRLFRNDPAVFWRSRCHEFIDYSLREDGGYSIADSTITIMHDGYEQTDTQGILDKFSRNYRLLCAEIIAPHNEAIGVHAVKYALITGTHIRQLTGI